MLELTQEQRQEVRHAGENPDTRAEYIVLRAEVYERMRRAFEEIDPSHYEFEEAVPV